MPMINPPTTHMRRVSVLTRSFRSSSNLGSKCFLVTNSLVTYAATLSKTNFNAAKPAPSVITSVINCMRHIVAVNRFTTRSSKDSSFKSTLSSKDLKSSLVAKPSVTSSKTLMWASAPFAVTPASLRVFTALRVLNAVVAIKNILLPQKYRPSLGAFQDYWRLS